MASQVLIELETGHQLLPPSGQPWQAIGDFVVLLERYCHDRFSPDEEELSELFRELEANVAEELCLLAHARSHPWHWYGIDQYDQFVADNGPALTRAQFEAMIKQAARSWADPAALQAILRQLVTALAPLTMTGVDLRQIMLDAEDVVAALRVADRAGLRVRLLVY
jgi:hypothetical protein